MSFEGRLISRSSTTGWWDWIHGELWLFDDGLLRVRTDLTTTMSNGTGRSVPHELPAKTFEPEEREHAVGAHRTNLFIDWNDVREAQLRRGLLCGRLRVKLVNGTERKLLWLRSDHADEPLTATLTDRLGARLAFT
ncbi:MAG TPA: hypothetical protein VNP89_07395 [Gaiellaceae bacterium]|nr:hypothetical protein [Gaiellaceae bacterium]